MLEVGSVIDGKYKVLNEIGHGGMSTVYLAINEKVNKPWAIKEVRKSGVKNFEVVKQSLLVETDMLKKLSHPNLPSIVDIIEHDDDFLIVMDYVEGVTLEKLLKEKKALNQSDVVSYALQICDVLNYLHTRKPPIIYRDMKPSNIMLKSDGKVVLIDFGTAREYKEMDKASDTTCLGTRGYAAPEQFGGLGQTDARTDVYCLGATMYHLVTGHNPCEPPYEMYPITYWNPNLSTGLEKIIQKCTQNNPLDRYQTVAELTFALEHYKDLDESALHRYKRIVATFGLCAVLSVACALGSLGMHVGAMSLQRDTYQEALDKAERASSIEETAQYYIDAIEVDNSEYEAYEKLSNALLEDEVFSLEDEEYIDALDSNATGILASFKVANPESYADFCYQVGIGYWFYYEDEDSRQTKAARWFEDAASIYEGIEGRDIEYRRSKLYSDIGTFYKTIRRNLIEGTDAGVYGDYWRNLVALKEMNDENPDRTLITLRLYEEIVSRSLEYAVYLEQDGVTLDEILEVYDSILEDLDKIEQDSTQEQIIEEVDSIRGYINESREKMLKSTYGK